MIEVWKDIVQALSAEQQNHVLDAAADLRSPVVRTLAPTLLLTGTRAGRECL